MHVAAKKGRTDIVRYLVEKNAVIHIKGNSGVCMTILLMIH